MILSLMTMIGSVGPRSSFWISGDLAGLYNFLVVPSGKLNIASVVGVPTMLIEALFSKNMLLSMTAVKLITVVILGTEVSILAKYTSAVKLVS